MPMDLSGRAGQRRCQIQRQHDDQSSVIYTRTQPAVASSRERGVAYGTSRTVSVASRPIRRHATAGRRAISVLSKDR
jgi:hypothetical protein